MVECVLSTSEGHEMWLKPQKKTKDLIVRVVCQTAKTKHMTSCEQVAIMSTHILQGAEL